MAEEDEPQIRKVVGDPTSGHRPVNTQVRPLHPESSNLNNSTQTF
jgi:hypothetical protein